MPAANFCTSIAKGTWARSLTTGDKFKASGGVKTSSVLGISLKINANYGSSSNKERILYYRPSKTVTICGDTDYPSMASKPRVTT